MQEQNDFQTSAMTEEKTRAPSAITPHLNLKIFPDGILSRKCEPVTVFDDALGQTVIALMKLMYTADGVGLSACQAGIAKKIVVYKIDDQEGYFINPEIVARSEEKQTLKEGCLSFPGVFITVARHKEVTIKFQDVGGAWQELQATGLLAQMAQHELDHLDGIVFTRYISQLKRDVVNRKMAKLKKELERKRELYDRLEAAKRRDTGDYNFSVPSEQV